MIFCAGGEARVVVRRESFEDLVGAIRTAARGDRRGLRMAGDFTVGLLGHGTVGAAFAQLLDERADEIERFDGRRPGARRRADALAWRASRRSSPARI